MAEFAFLGEISGGKTKCRLIIMYSIKGNLTYHLGSGKKRGYLFCNSFGIFFHSIIDEIIFI